MPGEDDQVIRRKEFEAAHPDWRIWHDRGRGVWRAETEEREVVRYWLRDLLDRLDELMDSEPPSRM